MKARLGRALGGPWNRPERGRGPEGSSGHHGLQVWEKGEGDTSLLCSHKQMDLSQTSVLTMSLPCSEASQDSPVPAHKTLPSSSKPSIACPSCHLNLRAFHGTYLLPPPSDSPSRNAGCGLVWFSVFCFISF